ncbi:MAG TPA: cardiolipin synthase [Longimicrobiales bacterium]|nr:cardiolipin synthase [Longimicrobiales bacterium]
MSIPSWAVALAVVVHLVGFITSLVALLRTRTAQGTLAWLVSLNALPWLALPAWWLFGRKRFEGYVSARRGEDRELSELAAKASQGARAFHATVNAGRGDLQALEKLARMPILGSNDVDILVDGQETYESIFQGMERAQRTLLVQFYTVRDDEVGQRMQEILVRKARQGVMVRFLFDGAGSYHLPESWLNTLEEAGVRTAGFRLGRGVSLRSQLNFRNHRKVVVVDGAEGWVGGLNIGEEYLGRDPDIGAWRDTHLHIVGPASLGLQLAFVEDWHWATTEVLELDWTPPEAPDGGQVSAVMVASGPADPVETASLLIQHVIHAAERRLWMATPYLVPDEGVAAALVLARLRGLDVRILVPERPDIFLVHLAAFSYFGPLLDAGVRIFRYNAGFMHSKTFVMDDAVVGVGTLNLDNRSLRLNFEITAVLVDETAAVRMEEVFEADFARSTELTADDLVRLPLATRLGSRAARLLAPVL